MRWVALVAGLALIVLAFGAATRVEDSRQGLVAEVITLLAGLGGVTLLIYGLAARARPPAPQTASTERATLATQRRTSRDLLLGAGGVALALVLLGGLAFSGGLMWAGFGLALLLPMLAGSAYLCFRYLRSDH